MAILSCCSSTGVASAGDIVSDSGAAEDMQKAAEIARPGFYRLPKGSFHFIAKYFCPTDVKLLIKDDRLSEWKPMFSVDCKTGKPFSFSGIMIEGVRREHKGPPSLPITFKIKVPSIKRKVQGFSRIRKSRHQVFSRRDRVERA